MQGVRAARSSLQTDERYMPQHDLVRPDGH